MLCEKSFLYYFIYFIEMWSKQSSNICLSKRKSVTCDFCNIWHWTAVEFQLLWYSRKISIFKNRAWKQCIFGWCSFFWLYIYSYLHDFFWQRNKRNIRDAKRYRSWIRLETFKTFLIPFHLVTTVDSGCGPIATTYESQCRNGSNL